MAQLLNAVPEAAMQADWRGQRPLHVAAQRDYAELVQQLLAAVPVAAMKRDEDWQTPLHLSAQGGHARAVQQLLLAMKGRWTPLHMAAERPCRGNPAAVAGSSRHSNGSR
jgi:ankyrin repeat protein